MAKAVWIWIAFLLASATLATAVHVAPAEAAAGFTLLATLDESEATQLASMANGKVDFRNQLTSQQLRVEVSLPRIAGQSVVIALDGTNLASLSLDARGRGRLQLVAGTGGSATPAAAAAMAAAHAGSLISVTTDTGLLLLFGTLF